MNYISTVVGLFIVIQTQGEAAYIVNAENNQKSCFPTNFKIGVATASYQIEGAWNVSGKGESIWDHLTHTRPNNIVNKDTGDVADDSYHQFKTDIKMLKELNVDFYRFSISWPRILPDGFSNDINNDGIRYYQELLAELKKNNIVPLVTMYHWDLPQALEELGGWTNPIMAEYFLDYATVLFDQFGDQVHEWITFNEPLSFCGNGYGGQEAPGRNSNGLEDYMCAHNILRAHGMVYRYFHQRFEKGYVGITLDMEWLEPTTKDDEEAAENVRQFTFGWFAHPIFSKEGDYPPIMRKRVDELSKKQGYPRSRLPNFTQDEIQMIRGAYDFLGFNHYTTSMVTKGSTEMASHEGNFNEDMGNPLRYKQPQWPSSSSSWLKVVPWGFRKCLNWIKETYDNPLVVVTENGISTPKGLTDVARLNYTKSYLMSLLDAITIDKCNVCGYTHWSLLDNFEWLRGYSERFGLYEVDFSSPNRTRTARESAKYFSEVARTKCIDN